MAVDHWANVKVRHQESVARGEHDAECEWSADEGFFLCNCSKRAREAAGKTELPCIYFEFPECGGCGNAVDHNGDCFTCATCHVRWSSNAGDADQAVEFTDDHGDLSYCDEHHRRGCWHCSRKAAS